MAFMIATNSAPERPGRPAQEPLIRVKAMNMGKQAVITISAAAMQMIDRHVIAAGGAFWQKGDPITIYKGTGPDAGAFRLRRIRSPQARKFARKGNHGSVFTALSVLGVAADFDKKVVPTLTPEGDIEFRLS